MNPDRDLGEGFEYILEIDRELMPTPKAVLEDPEKYLVRRLATPKEKDRLESFVEFINDPKRGKRLDSDMLRAQACEFDPVINYLNWLEQSDHLSEDEKYQVAEMAIDREVEIQQLERDPVNLMGHIIEIERNYSERMMINRMLPLFTSGADFVNRLIALQKKWLNRKDSQH